VAAAGTRSPTVPWAWDHLQHGEFDAAAEELGDARCPQPARYVDPLLPGRAEVPHCKSQHTDIQGLPNMMQDLRAVLDWYPEFAEAYDLMATATQGWRRYNRRDAGGARGHATQSAQSGVRLPLAEIYIEAKKWEAARSPVGAFEDERQSAGCGGSARAVDEAGQRAEIRTLDASNSAPKFSPQSSPFDVLEQDAAKNRAAEAQTTQTPGVGDRRAAKFLQGRLVGVDCSQSSGRRSHPWPPPELF